MTKCFLPTPIEFMRLVFKVENEKVRCSSISEKTKLKVHILYYYERALFFANWSEKGIRRYLNHSHNCDIIPQTLR